MTVKFVDNNNFFVLLNGPSLSIYTSFGLSAFSIVETNNDITHGSYFYVSSPTQDYCVWFDMINDDPPNVNMSTIRIDMSTGNVLDNLISTFEHINEFTVSNNEGLLEIQCNIIGDCKPPSDYNTGFNFLYQLPGYNPNTLVRSDQFGKEIVEILDVDFTSSTDTLELLVKKKTRTNLGKDIGISNKFDYLYKSINNWFFGY